MAPRIPAPLTPPGYPWIDVDLTDGSWTALDPSTAAYLKSLTVSSGTHRFTFKTATASADYCPITSGNFTGPRYYKRLLLPDGTPAVAADNVRLEMLVRHRAPLSQANALVLLGLALDPTATTVGGMDFASIYAGFRAASGGAHTAGFMRVDAAGGLVADSASHYQTSGSVKVMGQRMAGIEYEALSSAGLYLNGGSQSNNLSIASAAAPLYLCLAVGPSGNAVAAVNDSDVASSWKYRVVPTPTLYE